MFETQKSRNKTSSGDIGLNIRTLASPKVGQDQVSEGVSVPCQHATPVADALWKPLFSNIKFSKKSNRGKGRELVVSNQGQESNSVRNQIGERVVNWWCNVWLSVSGLNKFVFYNHCPVCSKTVCCIAIFLNVGYYWLSYILQKKKLHRCPLLFFHA